MKFSKTFFAILAFLGTGLITYSLFNWPENTIFIAGLSLFSFICYRNPLAGLCLLLILPVLGEFSRLVILGRSLVLSDLVIPIFEVAVILKLQSYEFSKNFQKVLSLLGIFLGIATVSLIFSLTSLSTSEVFQGSLYLIRLILYLALLPISYLIINNGNYQKLLVFLCLSIAALSATGYLQLFFLPNLEELSKIAGYDPHINRLVGSWLDPNFIGGIFAVTTTILLALSLYERSSRLKTIYIVTVLITLPALFLTYSRSAYLALAGGIILLGLLKARKLLITFLIIAAIGIASSDRAQQRVGELVTSVNSVLFNTAENPDPTARLRIQNWDQTVQLISAKPLLGHGYNTLTFVKLNAGFIEDENVHSASGSDSSLLTILVTTGFLGLLPFLCVFLKTLKDSFLIWKKSHSKELQGLGLGILCGLIGLLIHSNFVNSLLFPQIMIYLWLFIGLFYRLQSNTEPQ